MCDLNLWPYGNAHEKKAHLKDEWIFTCQHGADECTFNTLEACALNLIDDKLTALKFVVCVEGELSNKNKDIKNITSTCAMSSGMTVFNFAICVEKELSMNDKSV